MTTLADFHAYHFTDGTRRAALHLLRGDFGARLREIGTITDDGACLTVSLPPRIRWTLSSGEVALTDALLSLAHDGQPMHLVDLAAVDDICWESVIAALFIARGKSLGVAR